MTRIALGAKTAIVATAILSFSCRGHAAETGTLGFAVTSLFTAVYQTKYMTECPHGLAMSNDEIWWTSLSRADRDRLTDNGNEDPMGGKRLMISGMRGPHGENVCWNPTIVHDPPLIEAEGKVSYGLNLDGTDDGRATSHSCAHQKFTGLNGEKGVDNQVYRILGCIHGWRSDGYMENNANRERRDTSLGITMIEVTGYDPAKADQTVKVGFYRAVTPLPKDSNGNILAGASYRIDDTRRYGTVAAGHIVNGVLTTDPVDVHLPFYGNVVEMEMYIKDMRLQLAIAPDGKSAKGMIAGYHDLENWWGYMQRTGVFAASGQFSCPALYEASHRLADGYPDAKTGECTALSSAYNIEAVSAFIVHPAGEVAAAGTGARGR
jgi:hypothetical protein